MLGVDCSCMCPSIEFWSLNTLTYTGLHTHYDDHWLFRYIQFCQLCVDNDFYFIIDNRRSRSCTLHGLKWGDINHLSLNDTIQPVLWFYTWHTGRTPVHWVQFRDIPQLPLKSLYYFTSWNSDLGCKTNTIFANFNFKQEIICSKRNDK